GKNIYDESALVRLIRQLAPTNVLIEKAQSMPEQGVASMFTIGMGYGLIRGILAGLEFRYELVHPRTWQTKLFRDLPKSDTKAMSVIVAGRLWPAQDWRASERCKVAHNGLTDAALIAEYGRRLFARLGPKYDYSKPLEANDEDADELLESMGNRA